MSESERVREGWRKGGKKGGRQGKQREKRVLHYLLQLLCIYTNNGQKKQSRQLHTKHDNVHRNNALVHLLHESKTQLINNKK